MRFAAIILSNASKVALPTGIGISMKIAQIAPLYEAVPPKLYGGTERIVAHLSNALVELGHQVTLFASADADTRATLVPVRDQAIRLDPSLLQSNLAAHLSMLHELHLRRHAFDLLHFHVDLIHFPLFEDFAARTVTTLHGRLDLKDLAEVYSRWHDYPLVSISDDQRKPLTSKAATLLGDYEAKIVALERMVGRQALEIEFLKGALQQGRLPRSAPMSVIAGPVVSRSLKDAG